MKKFLLTIIIVAITAPCAIAYDPGPPPEIGNLSGDQAIGDAEWPARLAGYWTPYSLPFTTRVPWYYQCEINAQTDVTWIRCPDMWHNIGEWMGPGPNRYLEWREHTWVPGLGFYAAMIGDDTFSSRYDVWVYDATNDAWWWYEISIAYDPSGPPWYKVDHGSAIMRFLVGRPLSPLQPERDLSDR